jgi:Zn-dependent protease
MTFATVFFGWIFSLCLHEFSHAIVAYYGGDTMPLGIEWDIAITDLQRVRFWGL